MRRDRSYCRDQIRRALADEQISEFELRLISGNRGVQWISCHWQPIGDGEGLLLGLWVTMSDVQARKEAEFKLLETVAAHFRIELSVNIGGYFDDTENDQFTHLSIDFEKYVDNAEAEELKAAWHFDRHIGNTDNQKEIHPLYHFQYGGNKLEAYQDKLGSTFLLEAPRLMQPPMDGILAIDFVLSNLQENCGKNLEQMENTLT